MNRKWAKIAVTLIALAMAAIRLWWPELKVDTTTLGLLAIALLPWLQSLIKSAELPGVLKIEFQEVAAAGERIVKDSSPLRNEDIPRPSYVAVAETDPTLALVGLRIEIERRIRLLAKRHELRETKVLGRMLRELRLRNILTGDVVSGLSDLIHSGNLAAHGADVPGNVATWATDTGPVILGQLDEIIKDTEVHGGG